LRDSPGAFPAEGTLIVRAHTGTSATMKSSCAR